MALRHARLLHALFTLLIPLNAARALKNITILKHNPSIQYTPPGILSAAECQSKPENNACSGRWWAEGTSYETFGPNTALSFEFQGSVLYLFGVKLDAGARAFASIDDNPPTVIEFSAPVSAPRPDQLIYTATDLDPGQQHTFRLEFSSPRSTSQNRRWMGVNYIMYTTRDDSTDLGDDDPTAPSAPSATDAASTNSPGAGGSDSGDSTRSDRPEPSSRSGTASNPTSQPLNAATLAGIAAGVTCGVVFLVLVPLVVCLVRRRLGAQRVQSVALLRLKHADSADSDAPSPSPTPTPAPGRYDPPDQRRYSAAFLSSASSPGAPVDERLPFALAPDPPRRHRIRRGPLRFLVHNPDASTASHVGSASDQHH